MRHLYPCPYNREVECSRRPCSERCSACGHNPIESARRRGYIQAGGMQKSPDGVSRLKVNRLSP